MCVVWNFVLPGVELSPCGVISGDGVISVGYIWDIRDSASVYGTFLCSEKPYLALARSKIVCKLVPGGQRLSRRLQSMQQLSE